MMKTAVMSLLFCLVSVVAVNETLAQTPSTSASASAFAGTWVLDRASTNTGKDFPRKLKNYKVTVADNELALNVKSEIEGNVEIEILSNRNSDAPEIVSNNASRSSIAPAGGGVSGNTLGSAKAEPINYGGTMALFFTPNNVTYNLNGEEVKLDIKQGDRVTGVARIKAKLDKSGKQIQFTTIRRMTTMKGDIEITVRETWKLSKDGKTIKFDRTVETPTARDQIVMVLAKAEA